MGFENFGTVSFTTEAKTEEFISFLEQGKVMTTRCKKCGNAIFPPKMDCPDCLDSDTEWFEISNPGVLVTCTVVHYGPSGFEDEAPYALGIGDFDGVRIFGRFSKDLEEDEIQPGMSITISPVKSGEKIAYEFGKV
ncbi:MAG: Zn-ribbon domain-containing OB-fold protein [Dehalococcoidales bacterium]|nr:Zn-ribbon domain-containing OB-fold protein [Dehalococcoidales bacterium]